MIREFGFEMVGVRDIAEKSGVSTGTLYYYFPSKEAIIWAHAMENAEKFKEGLSALSSTSAYDKIVEYCVHCLGDIIAEDGSEIIFWILQKRQVHSTLYAAVLSLVEEGIERGEISNEKGAEDLTIYILDCYRGAAFAWNRSEGSLDIHQLIYEHVAFPLEHFRIK